MSFTNRIDRNYSGNVRHLADTADDLLSALDVIEKGKITERLVRFYVSTHLLDVPIKDGREALYGAIHLAKLCAIRILLAEGFTLSRIKDIVSTINIDPCERLIDRQTRSSEIAILEQQRSAAINRYADQGSSRVIRSERITDRSLLQSPTYTVSTVSMITNDVTESRPEPFETDLDEDLFELAALLLERPGIVEGLLTKSPTRHIDGTERSRTVTWQLADGIQVLLDLTRLDMKDAKQIKSLEMAFAAMLKQEHQQALASHALLRTMHRLQESLVWLLRRDKP